MDNLSLTEISNVRIGKHITFYVETSDEDSAKKIVEDACKKLLCNQIMESFTFTLNPS